MKQFHVSALQRFMSLGLVLILTTGLAMPALAAEKLVPACDETWIITAY